MQAKDFQGATGWVKCELFDKDGNLKDSWEDHNLVVTAGKTALASRLSSDGPSGQFMPYMALGSGTTSPQATDVAMESELARVAGVITSAANVYQNVGTFSAGTGTGTIAELGLMSASSSGTLFARQTFSARPKDATDSLVVTWSVTLS